MKKIIEYLKVYYKDCFSWRSFTVCVLWAALLTFFAYENRNYEQWIENIVDVKLQIFRYIILYALAFTGAFLLQGIVNKNLKFLTSPQWWILNIIALVVFAVRGSDIDNLSLIGYQIPNGFYTYAYKIGYNVSGFVWIIIPCFLYWFLVDRKHMPFYGFHSKGVTFKPYFVLLLLMVPLLTYAATQPDFLRMYPRLSRINVSTDHANYPLLAGIYELVYGLDFVYTEFFFRGFLILAFARKFGHQAILPMCVFYVTIHFGKPLGETISSFFGGLLLGVIAYQSKSIYGGIIVHVGIAYLMEVFAGIGNYYLGNI
jgi:membrane protease YdiL (CAAX protease family)